MVGHAHLISLTPGLFPLHCVGNRANGDALVVGGPMRRAEGLDVAMARHLLCAALWAARIQTRVAWGPPSNCAMRKGAAQTRNTRSLYRHEAPRSCASAARAQRRKILGPRCAQAASQESVRNFVSTSASWCGVFARCVLGFPITQTGAKSSIVEKARVTECWKQAIEP
jgi:hypothetical protein